MSSTTAANMIEVMEATFREKGFPDIIRTDQGPPFQSKEFKEWAYLHGIVIEHSPPYHPEGNGMVERAMRGINRFLKSCVMRNITKPASWKKELRKYVQFYNARRHRTTGLSPDELMEKRKKVIGLPLAREEWEFNSKEREMLDNYHNKKKSDSKFYRDRIKRARRRNTKPGDLVWIIKNKPCNKLDSMYITEQKYIVLSRVGNTVTLKGSENGKIVERNLSQCLNCPVATREKRSDEIWQSIRNYHGQSSLPDVDVGMEKESEEDINNAPELLVELEDEITETPETPLGEVRKAKDNFDAALREADHPSYRKEITDVAGIPLFLIPHTKELLKNTGSMDDVNKLVGKQISEDLSGRSQRKAKMKAIADLTAGFKQKLFFVQTISPSVEEEIID